MLKAPLPPARKGVPTSSGYRNLDKLVRVHGIAILSKKVAEMTSNSSIVGTVFLVVLLFAALQHGSHAAGSWPNAIELIHPIKWHCMATGQTQTVVDWYS